MRWFREIPEGIERRRWLLMAKKVIGKDQPEGPLLVRYLLVQTPAFSVYVHNILRPDVDRDCHDHPWWFGTLVLSGGYLERVVDRPAEPGGDRARWSTRGQAHVVPTTTAHRLVEVLPSTWTLLLVGRKVRRWGFWLRDEVETVGTFLGAPVGVAKPPQWVYWRTYGAATADPMDS